MNKEITTPATECVESISKQLEYLDKKHEHLEMWSFIKPAFRYVLLAGSALSAAAAGTAVTGILPISPMATTVALVLTVPATAICLATNLLSTRGDESKLNELSEQMGLLEHKRHEIEIERNPTKSPDMFLGLLTNKGTTENPPSTTIKQMEYHETGAKGLSR